MFDGQNSKFMSICALGAGASTSAAAAVQRARAASCLLVISEISASPNLGMHYGLQKRGVQCVLGCMQLLLLLHACWLQGVPGA